MAALTLKSRKLRRIISGSPKIIISDGVIDQNQLKELSYTADDVLEALRSQGIFDISEVQFAVIETTGAVSVYQKPSKQPVSYESAAQPPVNDNPPQVVIDDGDVIEKSLKFLGLSDEWLDSTLSSEQLNCHQVFIMTAKTDGTYRIVRKEGRR